MLEGSKRTMKQVIYVVQAGNRTGARIRLRGLLIAAAGLHLLTATAVFVIGRFSLMPSHFDSNGLAPAAGGSAVHRFKDSTKEAN